MSEKEKFFIKAGGQKVEITHPDKVLFPKSKITKKDVATYYKKVAKTMIFHMKDRPVSMSRFPDGIKKEGFFQKNISAFFPKWIPSVPITRKGQGSIKMVLCNQEATLLYLANLACLTPHIWLSRKDQLNYPDRMIFDLDPAKKDFKEVAVAAVFLKKVLDKCKLPSFVMTTGSLGVHVVVPIMRKYTFDQVRKCAKKIAQMLVDENPKKYTLNPRKDQRRGKIFIDYLRNGFAQTTVAPYSIRAIEGAPIATPIEWRELTSAKMHAKFFTMQNIFQRLSKKQDPWKKINQRLGSLAKIME